MSRAPFILLLAAAVTAAAPSCRGGERPAYREGERFLHVRARVEVVRPAQPGPPGPEGDLPFLADPAIQMPQGGRGGETIVDFWKSPLRRVRRIEGPQGTTWIWADPDATILWKEDSPDAQVYPAPLDRSLEPLLDPEVVGHAVLRPGQAPRDSIRYRDEKNGEVLVRVVTAREGNALRLRLEQAPGERPLQEWTLEEAVSLGDGEGWRRASLDLLDPLGRVTASYRYEVVTAQEGGPPPRDRLPEGVPVLDLRLGGLPLRYRWRESFSPAEMVGIVGRNREILARAPRRADPPPQDLRLPSGGVDALEVEWLGQADALDREVLLVVFCCMDCPGFLALRESVIPFQKANPGLGVVVVHPSGYTSADASRTYGEPFPSGWRIGIDRPGTDPDRGRTWEKVGITAYPYVILLDRERRQIASALFEAPLHLARIRQILLPAPR